MEMEYIELEYAWKQSGMDKNQRMACFPVEYKQWLGKEISRLRYKKFELNNTLKHEDERDWRIIFQDSIQEEIDDLNKRLRLLNMTAEARQNKETNLELIKQVPIQNFYIGQLRKAGRLLAGKCPFHEDKSASFFIYPNNTWHCFGCQAGRDVVDFVMKLKNIDFNEACRLLN